MRQELIVRLMNYNHKTRGVSVRLDAAQDVGPPHPLQHTRDTSPPSSTSLRKIVIIFQKGARIARSVQWSRYGLDGPSSHARQRQYNISVYFNRSRPVVLLIFNKVIYSVLAQHQYIIVNTLILATCFGFCINHHQSSVYHMEVHSVCTYNIESHSVYIKP